MQDFTKLRVWQLAHEFSVAVLSSTSRQGMRNRDTIGQLHRSVASIAANIAEGCSQSSQAQFARFLAIAIGSTTESHNHLLLLRDTGTLPPELAEELVGRVNQLRPALIKLHGVVKGAASRGAPTAQ